MFRLISAAALMLSLLVIAAIAQDMPVTDADISADTPDLRTLDTDKPGENTASTELISTNYVFSPLSGIPLEDMSTGTTTLINSNSNDDNSNLASIGFLFQFEGASVTFFGVNTNGFMRLGGTASTGASFANQIDSTTNSPKIAPFWDDLCTGSGGRVHYKRVGAPGSQKLVIEWKNMKITRGAGCDGSGAGTFQVWLFEHTGIVQFVYGDGMVAAPDNGGYSVGMQSGEATNFASVTTAAGTVDFLTANNAQTNAITVGTSYVFTPNIPATPSGGSVTNLTHASLQLNWMDNADNETGYYIRRSTTGALDSYIHLGTFPANTTSFADSGLASNTQYFYIVNAISDSAVSQDLTFSPTTLPAANVSSTASGGLWSLPSTWSNGIVPQSLDIVTITSGATVIIDTAAVAGDVTVGSGGGSPATLKFSDTSVSSLTVGLNVTILPNNVFSSGATGTITTHVLTVGGNLMNDGTLDFSTNGNTAGAGIVFNNAVSKIFAGSGPVTDVRAITVNKGTTPANVLELMPANFTVQGSTTDSPASAYLTLNGGTIKISGTFSGSHRTFTPVSFFSFTKGVWLNNPNYTIGGINGSYLFNGLLRVSAGTFNVGVDAASTLQLGAGSTTTIEGGNINVTGGFGVQNYQSSSPISYTQTGGTLTTCTVSAPSLLACFELGLANWTGAISGGEIVVQKGGGLSYRNERGATGPAQLTGTTLRFGNAQTSGASSYVSIGRMPNVVVDTTGGSHSLFINAPETGNSITSRNLNIGVGGLLDIENFTFNMLGDTIVNNGAIKANDVNSNFFLGDGGNTNITYSGSGITSFMTRITLFAQSLTLNGTNNIRLRNLAVFTGNIINANKLTVGNNDAVVSTISFGVVSAQPPSGTLDVSPVFDLGTGGQSLSYLGPVGSASRTTGPEINPARSLVQLTNDINGTLTVAGGDLTVTNTLTLTRGVVAMGASKLIVNGGITRTIGYVDGALKWRLGGLATFTFPVGQGAYSPVVVAVSALPTNPSYMTITAVDTTLPGLFPPISASRYWKLVEEGDLSARLTFTYDNSDVNGNEANYQLWRSTGGAPAQVPGSTANPGANTVQSAVGLTDFTGDWGIGEGTDPGPVHISGRVATSSGNGIPNATVILTGGNLPGPVLVNTGSLGFYVFNGLQAGQTYTVTASAKRYRFPVGGQVVTPLGNMDDVNFTANPQE